MLPKGIIMKVDKLVAWRLALAALSERPSEANVSRKPIFMAPASPRSASVASSASK